MTKNTKPVSLGRIKIANDDNHIYMDVRIRDTDKKYYDDASEIMNLTLLIVLFTFD